MRTRAVLNVAGLIVLLSIAMWIGIASLAWSTWQSQQAAALLDSTDPLVPSPVDRTRSSVQYSTLAADETPTAASPSALTQRLTDLPTDALSVVAWVGVLRDAGVQVCLEESRSRPFDLRSEFFIPREQATVRDVLDECCRLDERYRWEWMEGTQIINVVPRRSLLDGTLGNVAFQGQTVHECLGDLTQHISPRPLRGARGYGNVMFWPIDMAAQEISVRDYLNLMVEQYDGMTWTIDSQGNASLAAPDSTRQAVQQRYRDQPVP